MSTNQAVSVTSGRPSLIFQPEHFQSRHIGPDAEDTAAMLAVVGAPSLDALIEEAIPSRIRLRKPLDAAEGLPEHEFLRELATIAAKNQLFKSYIGLGYADCVTPRASPATRRAT